MSFTDVQRVLGLFADGMAGEPLAIEVADDEHEVWPWRGSVVDEPVVRVPAVATDRGALRAAVLHHTGLVEFGSFAGRDAHERAFAAAARPALVRRIFGVLEDLRVDVETAARYPGARRDLGRVLACGTGGGT